MPNIHISLFRRGRAETTSLTIPLASLATTSILSLKVAVAERVRQDSKEPLRPDRVHVVVHGSERENGELCTFLHDGATVVVYEEEVLRNDRDEVDEATPQRGTSSMGFLSVEAKRALEHRRHPAPQRAGLDGVRPSPRGVIMALANALGVRNPIAQAPPPLPTPPPAELGPVSPTIANLFSVIAGHEEFEAAVVVALPFLTQLLKPELLQSFIDMGFDEERAVKALLLTGLDATMAMEWLLNHLDDPELDNPFSMRQVMGLLRMALLMQRQHALQGQLAHAQASEAASPVDAAGNDAPPLTEDSPEIKQALERKQCTFAVTGSAYAIQRYRECLTCGLGGGRAVCQSCASVCHAGHALSATVYQGSFFCDCGAGDGPEPCMALAEGKHAKVEEEEEEDKEEDKEEEEEEQQDPPEATHQDQHDTSTTHPPPRWRSMGHAPGAYQSMLALPASHVPDTQPEAAASFLRVTPIPRVNAPIKVDSRRNRYSASTADAVALAAPVCVTWYRFDDVLTGVRPDEVAQIVPLLTELHQLLRYMPSEATVPEEGSPSRVSRRRRVGLDGAGLVPPSVFPIFERILQDPDRVVAPVVHLFARLMLFSHVADRFLCPVGRGASVAAALASGGVVSPQAPATPPHVLLDVVAKAASGADPATAAGRALMMECLALAINVTGRPSHVAASLIASRVPLLLRTTMGVFVRAGDGDRFRLSLALVSNVLCAASVLFPAADEDHREVAVDIEGWQATATALARVLVEMLRSVHVPMVARRDALLCLIRFLGIQWPVQRGILRGRARRVAQTACVEAGLRSVVGILLGMRVLGVDGYARVVSELLTL